MSNTINPFGKDIIKVESEFCGRKISLETGRLAFQTSGAVMVRYGDTAILGIAEVADEVQEGASYFPLMVDYEEKMYAAGKISGSRFVKKEGRPSDQAITTSRLIDRPIRPLFPKGYYYNTQGIATVLSLDPELGGDIVGMIAVSAAMSLTGAPFAGPIGGVRIGRVDGELIAFPTEEEMEKSDLDLIVAGTKEAIMMVEAAAGEVDEETVVDAIELAHEAIQPVIDLQNELIDKVGVEDQEYELHEQDLSLIDKVEASLGDNVHTLAAQSGEKNSKALQAEELERIKEELLKDYSGEDEAEYVSKIEEAFDALIKKNLRHKILHEEERPDGRAVDEVRPLSSEVGVLPRTHGSAIFTRGLTQAMNITTLAPPSYKLILDNMEQDTEKFFIHHYNFPGYSVGEVRPMRGPGRREIGHGMLAERALSAVMPEKEDFPYMVRSVTEIMSSNGSTSMAAVCSGTLSLMDAGVPLKRPVSGIAMGLVTDGKKNVVLSDIRAEEDFAGDMDFKVAGTEKGITALQMDIKVAGITPDTMREALVQSKKGRAEILESMLSTLSAPREELSELAPRIESIHVNPEKVGAIIGKGGETINQIIEDTGVEIDIQDEGEVVIAATDKDSIEAAKQIIKNLTEEPEIGTIYEGEVVKVLDFGAFVEVLPNVDGLVHVSEMADHHVKHPSDVVSEGETVTVKLISIDDQGRLALSMKRVDDTKK